MTNVRAAEDTGIEVTNPFESFERSGDARSATARFRRALHGLSRRGELANHASAVQFFGEIVASSALPNRATAAVVTHLLPGRQVFLSALISGTEPISVIPKPRSIDSATLEAIARAIPVHLLSRDECADSERLLHHFETCAPGQSMVLLDIGGYFAPALKDVVEGFSGRIIGVVEDTENGIQRYERLNDLPAPIYSVARSPLKIAEDYQVGHSIVFSIDAILRSQGHLLQRSHALVIGFGKVGSAVAESLRARGCRVAIHDKDPVKLIHADARAYETYVELDNVLGQAELVIGATGNRSITKETFARLRNGAVLATVTSADDELALDELEGYDHQAVGEHVTRWRKGRHNFLLVNEGNAPNFIHGAVVGPYISLVQAEILLAGWALQRRAHSPGFYEVARDDREEVARVWLRSFSSGQAPQTYLRETGT